jgi:PhnB protein
VNITPHLCFEGHCETAFRFYQQVLEGRITTMLAYGDTPMAPQVAPEWQRKIVHAGLSFEGGELAGVDLLPGTYKSPQGFFLTLGIPTRERTEEVFRALSEGGTVQMPLQQTFWSCAFGVLVDRFGIPWEINCQEGPAA